MRRLCLTFRARTSDGFAGFGFVDMKFRFRIRLFTPDEYQPLRSVPLWLWLALPMLLGVQLWFHQFQGEPEADVRALQLSKPPPVNLLRAASMGEPSAFGRLLMLNLQGFDNQQGTSIPFRELDYHILGDWLDAIVALDEKADYPHFSASKVYTSTSDNERRRVMVEWVRRQFVGAPNRRWEWMAYAANTANYVLKDQELALELALELQELTTPGAVPNWARQMAVFFYENLNEYEASVSMLSNLLEAGEVTDPQEFVFLMERLEGLVKEMISRGEVSDRAEIEKIQSRLNALRGKFVEQFGVELQGEEG